MLNSNSRTYLDTNVYSRIADRCSLPINLGSLGNRTGSQVYLSPINIVEILQVTDELRREVLVRVLQEICTDRLLAEPELLIVDFIAERYQNDSLDQLRLQSPFSSTELARVWRDVKENPAKTFVFDDAIRERILHLKLFNQLTHVWFKGGGSFHDNSTALLGDYHGVSLREMATLMKQTIDEMKARTPESENAWPFRDMLLMLVCSLLVVGITPFPEAIDKLWQSLAIETTTERLEYVFKGPLGFLLNEGPLVGMAAVMAHQLSNRFNPGNLLDAFHIVYLPYISELLTFDRAMLTIAHTYPDSPNFTRVQPADKFVDELFI